MFVSSSLIGRSVSFTRRSMENIADKGVIATCHIDIYTYMYTCMCDGESTMCAPVVVYVCVCACVCVSVYEVENVGGVRGCTSATPTLHDTIEIYIYI